MKLRNKKLIGVLSVFILGMSLVVGCSSTSDDESNVSSNDTANEKLIVGVSTEYAPWCFVENDENKGFEIDVWTEIAQRAGFDIEYQTAKFSGLIGMLDAGKIDTIANQMSTTPERLEIYDFTDTYAYSKYKFVVPEDSTISKIEDVKGMKVGCVLGGNGEKTIRALNEEYNLELDIVTYDGVPMEQDVELGRIDAAWLSEVKAQTTIDESGLKLKIANVDTGVYEINQYPFRKEEQSADRIAKVNEAIQSMHEDGTFTALSNKWFGIDTTKEN